jgi:hypothetical protein
MLSMEQIEGALRELSRDYSGDHLNAGVVLGTAIKKLRGLEGEASEETPVEFNHGPVTITVTGLPDCVPADAFRLALGIHSPFDLPERERVAAFAETFTALGGIETFTDTDPAAPFSVLAEDASVAGHRSDLRLYPPGCTDDRVLLSSAIVTALDVDRHARDVRNEQMATTKEREAAQQAAGVLRGVGERAGWTDATGGGSVQAAVDAERARPVVLRQGGMPVAPECERGCVCDQACGAFDPCERLRP